MDVQDYEYFEARAEDVKLKDITSSSHNADILERLRDNDPDFIEFFIENDLRDDAFIVRKGDHLGWLGYFIGRSKHVEDLHIDYFPNDLKIDAFFEGLGHNRSIQNLLISTDLGERFQRLVPLLRNNGSLSHLTFSGLYTGFESSHNIASLLGQQCSLRCLNFEEANLGDEMLVEIATALRKQPQIEELNLFSSNIGRNGCVALGNALEGIRNPNLVTLKVEYNRIDDEGLHALVAGLINCHNLKSLCLSGNELITEAGLRSLSALFQSDHCLLEHLGLYQANIDDDKVVELAAGLASLPSLKILNLGNNSIGEQGLQALVGGLVSCNLLEDLYLSDNSFSSSRHQSLGTLVQGATRLKTLGLRDNAINDEGLQGLVEGMTQHCSLKTLELSNNHSITAEGLRGFAPFFQTDICCLKELRLFGINFGDEGAAALANGLMGNKSLTDLKFDSRGIAARGWAAFSKLLCDTSSVNNTYLSNHTLTKIGEYDMYDTPSDIVEYLKLNELQNCNAAICKILDSHPDIDIEPLFQWKLKCLPLVVSWLENARSYLGNVNESTGTFQCRQLSAVYKFVRGMPLLTVAGYRGQKMTDAQSKKRKFDQTL